MSATPTETLIHYRPGVSAPPVCGGDMAEPGSAAFGNVTCFACRANSKFKADQRGVETPTPLGQVMAGAPEIQALAAGALAALWKNERGMYTIEEVIHHGDYRSVRRVEVYDINPVTVDCIIQSSAYCYGSWLDPNGPYPDARRPKLFELVEDLKAGRTNRSIGWSTFRLVK